MKNIEGQLESIEEVIQQLIEKATGIEKAVKAIPETIQVPDHSDELLALKEQVKGLESNLNPNQLMEMLLHLERRVKSIPAVIPVKHHHHIQSKSKAFIISGIAAFLIAALSFGFALYSWNEQKLLKGESIKYRMISQLYPKDSFWADTAYRGAPEKAELWVEQLEAEQKELIKMEKLAKEQQETLKEKKKSRNSLRKVYGKD